MSRRIAIVTDSTSDLPADEQLAYGLTVVPLNIHFGQETYRDRIDLSADGFMQKLDESDKLPTTSQPSVSAFEEVFRTLAATHDEILCVLISSRMSGTVQSATLAAEAVSSFVPVTVFDSLNVSSALGFMVERAAELVAGGASASETVAILGSELDRYHIIFFVETMEHLRRGGRIGKAAQLLGSLLQLKPLLRVEEGLVVPFERTRTRSKATHALVDFVREMDTIERAAVLHNTTPIDADVLAQELAQATRHASWPVIQIGPVISTHVGPGVLGIALKEISSE